MNHDGKEYKLTKTDVTKGYSCEQCAFSERLDCSGIDCGGYKTTHFIEKKYRTEAKGKFIGKAIELETITWYKKRFPKIKSIRSNEEHGVTVVKLKDGREGRTKISPSDEWNLELGVMHAYVKALESNMVESGSWMAEKAEASPAIDMTYAVLNADTINIETTSDSAINNLLCCNEVRVSKNKYYIIDNTVEFDCGRTTLNLTLKKMR